MSLVLSVNAFYMLNFTLCSFLGSVQEMSQIQIKLQQTQSSLNICECMNKALQVSDTVLYFVCPHGLLDIQNLYSSHNKCILFCGYVFFFIPQEELNELKGQITLYESAVKLGAVSFESNKDVENQLSESYIDLGIKKSNWKHTHTNHR